MDIAVMTDFMRGNNEDPNRALDIKNPISESIRKTPAGCT